MQFSKTAILFFLACILLFGAAAPAFAEPAEVIKQGDILCFGKPDEVSGFDGKWLVLDADHTNTGEDGMFLVSLNLIGDGQGNTLIYRTLEEDVSVSFRDTGGAYAASHPGALDYQGSDLQQWCAGFLSEHFSTVEQAALIPTSKSDAAVVIPGFGIPLPGATGGTVDFDPAENVLQNDRLFILSVEEVTNEQYGFTDNRSRVALFKGIPEGYWLRSPHIPTFPLDVGFVFSFGQVMDFAVNAKTMFAQDTYVRLACNLDREAVSSIEELSSAGGKTIWRVSFRGEENNRDYDLSLPVVGEVMNLNRTIQIAFGIIVCLFALILFLIFRLILKVIRKRKQ